jgi:hypothetical protein
LVVFFEFVGISRISVSVSAIDHTSVTIDRTATFRCSVCVPALDRLQVRGSAYQSQTDSRAQSLDARVQCALTIDHTYIAIECTSRLLHLCMPMLDRTVPALECISTVSTSKLEVAKYIVFFFFWFIVIFLYLFIFQYQSFIFYLLLIFVNKFIFV